jgi:hypothetical protein
MRITVTTKPRSKVEKVERVDDKNFVVSVRALPVEGQANRAVLLALADYLEVPLSRIRIVSGAGARKKIIDIDE